MASIANDMDFATIAGPHGTRLLCPLDDAAIRAAVLLVEHEYWNEGVERDRLERAMRCSTVVVGAEDPAGRLVACARTLSDGARTAWVGDVCVARGWRGRGVGIAVVRLLLDHPLVRDVDRVRLNTRDAQALYRKLGFVETAGATKPYPSHEMVLRRR
jgi:ribosomal protein S18 acetylase RimI-like enzyme